MTTAVLESNTIIDAEQVRLMLGSISPKTLTLWMANDQTFPRPFFLGAGKSKRPRRRWLKTDIEEYVAGRVAAGRAEQ